jgi:class 3 adenylate cyclase/tRNA A-37 threonylcarbamoyl transferase component Bud32
MVEWLNGRYEPLETLGEGAEGRVVRALDHQHDRVVALKIRPVRSAVAREELLGEARILLSVPPHPALPLVREDFFDGDNYVIAMDWVDGTNLAKLLVDRGRPGLAPSSVLAYLAEAAEALTHLHTQDPPVIHGDVKPGNLILTRGGRVKLVDFGMSSAPDAHRRRIGTPGFRAPELAADGSPSRASDVYALAATAFALLTGSAPLGVLPSWEGVDATQAAQLEEAIRLGLATDPARRPATPGEFVERLRAGWGSALPTGVMTFCLSDIEGSTSLWDQQPNAMAQALVRHDEIISDAVENNGGRFLKSMGEGDSTVSVFDSAQKAIEAVIVVNRALAIEPWAGGLSLRVRFGIHTGEAERRGTEYFGPTLNLAGRLRSQADGGQAFVSSVTADLVASSLPEGFTVVDLGPHRMRGLQAPERVFALSGPGVDAPRAATECPYRGLLAFQAGDRDLFFGREDVIDVALERLRRSGLLATVGASGSGKSSLIRAGIAGAADAGEIPGITRAQVITPGSEPTLDVSAAPDVLVVIDQFEELFTLCGDPARRAAFMDAILELVGPVVIGLRADFYGELSTYTAMADAVSANQILLGPMTEDQLRRTITEPARLAGLKLEPGFVDVVLRDVAGEPGALPLLSHALRATWERRDGRTLTVEGYHETGGVAAALARTADSVVEAMSDEERATARRVMLRMTELGEGTQDTRRRVGIDELVTEGGSAVTVHALLERLADARLVTLDGETAEVAHEVLIRSWPTLRPGLDEDR